MMNNKLPLNETIPEHYGRLVSLSVLCQAVTMAQFLLHAKGQPRFYFASQRDGIAFAGMGQAIELMGWGENRYTTVEQQARDLFTESVMLSDSPDFASPRLFGGFAFRDDFVSDYAWSDFTPAHFVLPHYQLTQVNDETWLTINTHLSMDENPNELHDALYDALMTKLAELETVDSTLSLASQVPTDVRYPMSYDDYQAMIDSATQRLKTTELNKVVLSRVCEIRFENNVNVDEALHYLADNYAECYRFLFESLPNHAFYGATPELLVSTDGKQIHTMGLAGSAKRGTTTAMDKAIATRFLNDPKERYEHDIVVQKIAEKLQSVTEYLTYSDTPKIYQLSNIRHLYTPFVGEMTEASGVIPMVKVLHPTPALGGDPQHLAMEVIREYETVPRGWYASPIGWIDGNLDGQFAVAIRSAVAQEKRVWMYAGGGIVADSIPQREWAETALKFRPMLNALGIEDAVDVES